MQQLDFIKLSQNIDKIAEEDFSDNKVFGSAYYVYQKGAEWEKCYGKMSLHTDTPITNTSIFRLASMSKPITAVATLILLERGLLSLDTPIDTYLPAFQDIDIIDDNGNRTKPIYLPTIRNILTHTSGIGCNVNKLSQMTYADRMTLDASVDFFVRMGLDFEPGSMQQYSGTGSFDVLTKIIETVSGQDYLRFLEKEIFQPCGMTDTTFLPSAEQQKRMVEMHTRTQDGENAVAPMPAGCVFEDYPSTHYLGGAGLVSTLRDYGKFAKMLLNDGQTEKGRILKDTTVQQLASPQVSQDIMPSAERWGLGVRVIADDSYPYLLPKGAYGWSGAYGSHFWIDPANQIFAVYMKNSKIDGGSGNESSIKFEKAVYSAFVN